MRVKETIRSLAVATTQQVAKHTSDPAAVSQCVAQLKGLLDGSAEGKIKVRRLQSRHGVLHRASQQCSPAQGLQETWGDLS